MPKVDPNKRHKTKYAGVYYRIKSKRSGRGTERVYYGRVKEGNTWREISLGRIKLDEARKRRQDILDGVDIVPSKEKNYILANLVEEYGLKNAPDKSRYENYLTPFWRENPLNNLQPPDIKRYLKWLRKQTFSCRKSGKETKLSDQSIKHCLGLHGLRHWFASELLERCGGDIYVVSKALTHSDISVTQRYITVRDKKQAQAMELMNL